MPENFATIQEAMAVAESGDTVFVAAGTYTGRNEFEVVPGYMVEAVVSLKPGVTLLGDPEAPGTVIIQAADSTFGIFVQDVDSTASIIGLTVTGARSGIIGRHASPTISHCLLTGNHNAGLPTAGGGMYGDYFSPVVSDCVFTDNVAVSGAGAAFANSSFPVLRRCVFSDNRAVDVSENEGHGGGLSVSQESVARLYDCILTGNEAVSAGGGMVIRDAQVFFTGGMISNNVSSDHGGGVDLYWGGHLEMTSTTVAANDAANDGGGFHLASGSFLAALDCVIRDNDAVTGPDGFLDDTFNPPTATLTCCDVDPEAWHGETVVIEDDDCGE